MTDYLGKYNAPPNKTATLIIHTQTFYFEFDDVPGNLPGSQLQL